MGIMGLCGLDENLGGVRFDYENVLVAGNNASACGHWSGCGVHRSANHERESDELAAGARVGCEGRYERSFHAEQG